MGRHKYPNLAVCDLGRRARISPANPTPERTILSQSRQPLDQPFLSAMLLSDRAWSVEEIVDRALLLGDRHEVG